MSNRLIKLSSLFTGFIPLFHGVVNLTGKSNERETTYLS